MKNMQGILVCLYDDLNFNCLFPQNNKSNTFVIFPLDDSTTFKRDLAQTKVFSGSIGRGNNDTALNCANLTLDQIFKLLHDKMLARTGSAVTDKRIQKAMAILAEGRTSVLTRDQLKSSFLYRLSIKISHDQIEGFTPNIHISIYKA